MIKDKAFQDHEANNKIDHEDHSSPTGTGASNNISHSHSHSNSNSNSNSQPTNETTVCSIYEAPFRQPF